MNTNSRWSEGAIVYQIYPRSLQDANGDGVGDLRGIISRLDYLRDLHVNALWLSPFYPSPMVDFGYDIADYCAVDPLFGTLDDFKELLRAAHDRDMKVLVDLVANHTSDEHPWFKESRSSRDNPKADWYIWQDESNNWRDGLMGGSAWEWDDVRQQYYLHSWHKRQPDLNWVNKQVREAIKDVMRFWLDLGVDGFRADAVDWLAKDPMYRDDSYNDEYAEGDDSPYDALAHNNSRGWPTEYAYLAEMTRVLEEERYAGQHKFLVAETYPERHNLADAYVAFYGGIDPEHAAPFNFEGLFLGWGASKWHRFLHAFHGGLERMSRDCIPSYAFGNHDNPRMVTRLGEAAARSAALMQLTLPGMIFIYYGEEIGMRNAELPDEALRDVYFRSRDPERTPMQWDATANAGFSDAPTTWLPLASDAATSNVAAQQHDPNSFLALYRTLTSLRTSIDALRYGTIELLDIEAPDVLGYLRRDAAGQAYLVLINFSDDSVICDPGVRVGQLLVSSDVQAQLANVAEGGVQLLPHEGALFRQ